MTEEELFILLERTGLFHEAVYDYVNTLAPVDTPRYGVAFQSGLLSLEHATGALALLGHGIFAASYALMRPQYECLLRGFWLTYSASDIWIEKLTRPLTTESAEQANKLPMPAEMLKDLTGCTIAPVPIVEQLKLYSEVTWRALSSFTHGGLHPLARILTGYPAQLTYDVVRNSNAVISLTSQLLSNLSGDDGNLKQVRSFHEKFSDCLPIIAAHQS